ncbi:MAG: YjbQ family protein [Deltaproteobacteria bacterium]|nr:YjbQ family protein [Deltaproteobacteria bacterium]
MHVVQAELVIETPGRGFTDLTDRVGRVVAESGVEVGLCSVFCRHTSASLVIQENADPTVRKDLEAAMLALAPEDDRWAHDDEGPDDMPAHLRTVLTKTSEQIPVRDGSLALGTWQALYLWEHRRRAHRRTVIVTVVGR